MLQPAPKATHPQFFQKRNPSLQGSQSVFHKRWQTNPKRSDPSATFWILRIRSGSSPRRASSTILPATCRRERGESGPPLVIGGLPYRKTRGVSEKPLRSKGCRLPWKKYTSNGQARYLFVNRTPVCLRSCFDVSKKYIWNGATEYDSPSIPCHFGGILTGAHIQIQAGHTTFRDRTSETWPNTTAHALISARHSYFHDWWKRVYECRLFFFFSGYLVQLGVKEHEKDTHP